MTLEQLKIFLTVVEHLHFTRAANALYITQPAVSAAIQNLENEYGVKLFHRIGRRIEITEAGRLLQNEARIILEQVAATKRSLRELNNLQKGELRIGSSFTVGNYWLPDKISLFKRQYPGIDIDCTLANADEICLGTASGVFDLGLIAGSVKLSVKECLEEEIIGSDDLEIIVGKSHPWFEVKNISLEQLRETEWIMREAGSGTQQIFEQVISKWDIDYKNLKVILVLNSSEMIKTVVENGLGAAVVPKLMVKKELNLSTLRAIEVISPAQKKHLKIQRPILKIKHHQRFSNPITQAFEQILYLD